MKDIVRGVLIAFLIILAIEILARVGKTVKDDINSARTTPFIYTPELGWELRPGFSGNIYNKRCSVDENGFLAEDSLQLINDEPKIVFIGDSWTFGNEVPVAATFAELIDDSLPNVSVINMGIPGYSSYQGYQSIRRRALRLNPVLIIVAFNLNDRRYVLHKEEMDSQDKFVALYRQQKRQNFFNNIYIFRSLNYLKSKFYSPKPVNLRDLYARVPPEVYHDNLIKIITICKEKNIPLVFLLVKVNPSSTENLFKGIELLNNSDYDRAIENLKIATSIKNFLPTLARKYLAEAYRKKGEVKKADETLLIEDPWISVHGGEVLYFAEEYNEIMRQVSREYNIELADPTSILDAESYIDLGGHLNEKGHEKVAQLLLNRITEIIHVSR